MIELKNSKVLVTGASSMIGRVVVKKLQKRGAVVIKILHEECDLLNWSQTLEALKQHKADYCVHAAGYNGNIKFNKLYPSDIFYNTTTMGLNVLKACAATGVKKVVTPLASCAYRSTDEELKENDFNIGMPDKSVEAHGLSKKTIYHFSRQLCKQHDISAVCTVFNTAYGPGDSFDINKTKVVGGLIKKFITAVKNGDEEVECWGTGKPRRELIYCEDAAEGIIQALEKYSDIKYPINIGYNEDISIKELANLIADLTGFSGKLTWDLTKPDGQYRKILDSSRMKEHGISIANKTSLRDGLLKTIKWYKENEN